jgi:purine-binding chemotaxis protein CheW
MQVQDIKSGTQQYLSFFLAEEEYAVDILRVQEIRVWEKLTRLPRVPAFVKGVLNLRGEIVPVVDLRERFGLPFEPYNNQTVIVVLNVRHEERITSMGIVVDRVADVYTLATDSLRSAPEIATTVGSEAVVGLASLDSHMLIVLDVDRLLSAKMLGEVVSTSS